MNRSTHLWALCFSLTLLGCANTPRFDLDLSLTDASQLATQSGSAARQIDSQPSGYFSSSIHSQVFIGPWYDDRNESDSLWSGGYDNRLLIGRQTSLNLGISRYDRLSGYQLAYAARFDTSQVRIALFYTDAQFPTASTNGLTEPALLGLDLDLQWLQPLGPFYLTAGGQMTFGQLLYSFQNPLTIDGIRIDSDGIGFFGLGVVTGLQFDMGNLTVEAQISPTLYFHNDVSNVGFSNDVVSLTVNIPVSIGVGVVF